MKAQVSNLLARSRLICAGGPEMKAQEAGWQGWTFVLLIPQGSKHIDKGRHEFHHNGKNEDKVCLSLGPCEGGRWSYGGYWIDASAYVPKSEFSLLRGGFYVFVAV